MASKAVEVREHSHIVLFHKSDNPQEQDRAGLKLSSVRSNHRIVEVPFSARVGDSHDIDHLPTAGEHHLLIINVITAVAAQDKP